VGMAGWYFWWGRWAGGEAFTAGIGNVIAGGGGAGGSATTGIAGLVGPVAPRKSIESPRRLMLWRYRRSGRCRRRCRGWCGWGRRAGGTAINYGSGTATGGVAGVGGSGFNGGNGGAGGSAYSYGTGDAIGVAGGAGTSGSGGAGGAGGVGGDAYIDFLSGGDSAATPTGASVEWWERHLWWGRWAGGEAYTLESVTSLLVEVVRAGLPPPASLGPVVLVVSGNQ